MTEKDKTLYYRGLVAANIKRLRQARHMGQKELAEESHVGIATISNLERALYTRLVGAAVDSGGSRRFLLGFVCGQ